MLAALMRSRSTAVAAATPKHCRTYLASTLATKHDGTPGSVDHRVRFTDAHGDLISPWHHIPLHVKNTSLVNFVAEIPKGERAKYEITTTEELNPIAFDLTKDGDPRLYPFPSLVNYGALPQTWEDPTVDDTHLNMKGDNDPLDVCEIGTRKARIGEVYPVKVLGVVALLDEGEVDWKVVAIRADDPAAQHIHDIPDVAPVFGSLLDTLVHWFRVYKVPDGKPENEFGFDAVPQNADFARGVVDDAHAAWRKLVHAPPPSSQDTMRSSSLHTGNPTSSHLWVPALSLA